MNAFLRHAPFIPVWKRIVSVGLILSLASFAPAADPAIEKLAGSLKFIPATAASFSASLRNREVFDNVANSKAWKAFTEMPVVQKAWAAIQDQIDEPLGQVEQFFDDPLNQDLLKMLIDMVSDEIFFYADEQSPEWLHLYQSVNASRMFAPLGAMFGGADPESAQVKGMLDALDARKDKLTMPHFVTGFKIKDANKAKVQIKRLELLIGFLPALLPQLQERITHQTVGGVDYLTISLDGGMIPWDDVPLDQFEEKEGQYKPLVEKLKQLKFVAALGVKENYVFLSFGAPLKALEKFDQGPKLAELPEFKKLVPFADRHVTSLSFQSGPLRTATESAGEQWQMFREKLEQAAAGGEAFGIPKELGARLREDLKKLTPLGPPVKYRPLLAIGCFAQRGFDQVEFDWTEDDTLDGSKPFTLLEHIGGNPLAFHIHRAKPSQSSFDSIVELVKLGHKYVEELAVPQFNDDEKATYKKLIQAVAPLAARFEKTTREKLLPALADGQSGFVLDAQIKSKQWLADVPQTARLPMLELSVVIGVSQRAQLEQAGSELRDAANDFLSQLDQFETPFQFLRIPEPKKKEIEGGKQYVFPLPEDWGLDKQIAPNIGLTDKVVTFSSSIKQTERMLKPTPLKLPGLLADTQRPLAAAHYFDFAGTVDAASPWIEVAAREVMGGGLGGLFFPFFLVDEHARPKIQPQQNDPPEVKEVLEQVQTVLEILKCFRSTAGITYRDGDVWVHRSESIFQDLP